MITTDTLNAWGSAWATFMGRALLDSSIVLVAVLLIWLPFRRRMSVQFAHGLFLLVLLKLAIPFPTSWPSWSVEIPIERLASEVATWKSSGLEGRPSSEPLLEVEPMVVVTSPEPIVAAAVPTQKPTPAPTIIPKLALNQKRPLSLSASLMLTWIAISLILLLRFARSIRVTNRLIRESQLIAAGQTWLPVDFEVLRRTAGIKVPIRWAISPKVTSPAVGGLLRPTVVMPPDLNEGLTAQQLNWVLLHELAHIRRGDLWVVMLQRLVGSVFFFHPGLHLANWVIDQLREYACDDAALAATQASRYACGEGFLTLVGRTVEPASFPSPALGLFESRMLIHRRLLRILDSRRAVQERLSKSATSGLVLLAIVVLPYGRHGNASVNPTKLIAPNALSPEPAEEPRLFAAGKEFLHDDRASSAGKPRSPVLAAAYSPDGRSLATAGEDASIVIRDPTSGSVKRRLEGHSDVVTCLAFSPDGSVLASGGYDRTIRFWNPLTGNLLSTLEGHSQWIFAVAFSPDGRTLASAGSDKVIRIWDVASRTARESLPGSSSAIRTLAFSPDGRTLASAGSDREATLWDLATLTHSTILKGHRGTIRAVAFSPDGKQVATAGEDVEIKLWDVKSGRERVTLAGHSDMVTTLAFTPSAATLASAGLDSTIKLWDIRTGRERTTLTGHADGILALAFAPGARQLATTGYDGTIRFWEPAAPTLSPASTQDLPGETRGLAFCLDGKGILTTGSSSLITTCDSLSGSIDSTTPGSGSCLAVSPDGKSIAAGGSDGKIHWLDGSTRQLIKSFSAHSGEVTALAFGADAQTLMSGGVDGKVLLHDLASGLIVRELEGLAGQVVGVQSSSTGSTVAVLTRGRVAEVDLFDVRSGRRLGTIARNGSEVSSFALTADGSRIATVSRDGTIAVFDGSSRLLRTSWNQAEGRVTAFSPDGRFLATGHQNGEVVLWNSASGLKLATLSGHHGPVSRLAFAPGGLTVASAGTDGKLRLWNLGARKLSPRTSLNAKLACIGPIAISGDGQTLAAAEVAYDATGHFVLWDAATRRVKATIHGHERGITSLAFSPDGRTLATSSWDLTVRLWDATTGAARGEFVSTEAVGRLAFSPDGKTLAFAAENKVLTLWDLEAGSELARIDGFRGAIYSVAFSPDGRKIATGGGRDARKDGFGEVKIFDASTQALLADLPGHAGAVWALDFTPDSSTLATGGVDSTVRLWDLNSQKSRLILGGFPDCIRALRFAPDGRCLAVAGRGDGVVSLLDGSTGGEIARLVGHSRVVLGLAFSPDGRTLATGGLDASIKLWDVPDNQAQVARR